MKNLILKLIQKYYLKIDSDIQPGDLVTHKNNDYVYEAVGIYFSYSLKPFLFIRDPDNGRIAGVPIHEYQRLQIASRILETNI